jgi:hypothetical protein
MILSREITTVDFIEHTAPAVKALFDAIAEEKARYAPLRSAFQSAHEMHYDDFITSDLQEDFNDHQVQHKYAQAAEAKMQAFLVSQSLEVLCGAVLQIGKQGISLLLKGGDRYSKGRAIGSQPLSNVVWHGRNQAMHWEDGPPTNKYMQGCFQTLAREFGAQFEFKESPRNMAWDVLSTIGWLSYDEYEKDMREILDN